MKTKVTKFGAQIGVKRPCLGVWANRSFSQIHSTVTFVYSQHPILEKTLE